MSQKDEREFSNYYFLIPLIIILIIIPLVIVFSLNLGSTTQTTQTITIESPSIYVLKGYFNEGNKVDVSWEVGNVPGGRVRSCFVRSIPHPLHNFVACFFTNPNLFFVPQFMHTIILVIFN